MLNDSDSFCLNILITSKSKEESKDQKLVQSSTTPNSGHQIGKVTKHKKHHIHENQEVSHSPAGEHKAASNIQDSMSKVKHK